MPRSSRKTKTEHYTVQNEVLQLDITAPEFQVQVEIDTKRRVLYVHVDGVTALRICKMKKGVEVLEDQHQIMALGDAT